MSDLNQRLNDLRWTLDALAALRDASIRYRLGAYGQEELKLFEERAERVIKALKPQLTDPVMTDFRSLCADLFDVVEDLFPLVAGKVKFTEELIVLMSRARAELAKPEPEVSYEFSVLNNEYFVKAGGTAPTLHHAIDEGRRYLAQYHQDGSYTLKVRRVETIPVPSRFR